MRRVVLLWLPTWPTDRLRRALGTDAPPADEPLVLLGREGRRRIVTAADRAAQRAGVRVGMAATQATAMLPGLHHQAAQQAEDAAALDLLALWALRRYAPIVAADPPDGLMLDVTGTAHLHGGEQAMLDDMIARLAATGVTACAAAAGTYGAAHALARYRARPTLVVDSAAAGTAIMDLPIAALRVSTDLIVGLRAIGFERIGDLAAQPRAPLALRFGSEPGRRLDQAFGRIAERFTSVELPQVIQATRGFVDPIASVESLTRVTGILVDDLCRQLEAGAVGARRLDLLFHRIDGGIEAIRVGTSKPTCDPGRLTRLLLERLDTVEPGLGVERMTLSASRVDPLIFRQVATSLIEAPEPDVSGLVDTLANRVGADRLYRLAAVQSDVPERSVRKVAPMAAATTGRWPPHWPRPTRLLPRPEQVETLALLPDNPPVQFTWRGTRRRVRHADGPERIHGEWEHRDAELLAVRDYFVVEDDAGGRFWLFRAGDGEDLATGSQRWFIHGVFG